LKTLKAFLKDDQGQDLVEYALLLSFLALAALAVLPVLGSSINRIFSSTSSSLGTAGS